ncbi:MAG: MFS transporter [Pseudomonadota bacterium]
MQAHIDQAAPKQRSPLYWVPSAYLTMGLVFVTLNSVAAVMFKNLGMDNGKAAEYASLLILAYTIKPLFSPIVEMYRTKKFFVLCAQVGIGIGFGVLALLLGSATSIAAILAVLFLISLLGSIQDIATDGVFVTELQAKQQSFYTGVMSLSWNLGPIIATGGLVYLSGYLHSQVFGNASTAAGPQWAASWQVICVLLAALCLVMPMWHARQMPPGAPAAHTPTSLKDGFRIMADAFVTFFHKPGIWRMIAFPLFYLVSIGLIDKVGAFFLVDPRESGGLGLNNEMLGLIYGTCGIAAVLAGSLLGGIYVSRVGLERCVMKLCIAVNIPNISFVMLAVAQPDNLYLIAAGVMVEKFFFGFGVVGLMVYMMQQMAPGPYVTAHYAFATAFKGLSFMLTGLVSGHLQQWLGYQSFFVLVMVATIPSFLVVWFAPFPHRGAGQPGHAPPPVPLNKAPAV